MNDQYHDLKRDRGRKLSLGRPKFLREVIQYKVVKQTESIGYLVVVSTAPLRRSKMGRFDTIDFPVPQRGWS